jgi:hypothetical protein
MYVLSTAIFMLVVSTAGRGPDAASAGNGEEAAGNGQDD